MIHNVRKEREQALQAYEKALSLCRETASGKPYEAMALRGIGYTQIELGRLSAARAAIEQSLHIEPNNAVLRRAYNPCRKLRSNAIGG